MEHDRDAVNAILSDDWTVIDATGRVLAKAQVIDEGFVSGTRKIEAGTIDDVKVRLFNDVAVVTGRTLATGNYQGVSVSAKLRFIDVCIKRGNNWQVVTSHATLIAE